MVKSVSPKEIDTAIDYVLQFRYIVRERDVISEHHSVEEKKPKLPKPDPAGRLTENRKKTEPD